MRISPDEKTQKLDTSVFTCSSGQTFLLLTHLHIQKHLPTIADLDFVNHKSDHVN